MKKIHFAVIGAGKMGTRWAKVIDKQPCAYVDVIVDKSMSNAYSLAKQIKGCMATDNVNDVLKWNHIDAVLIAVPHKYLTKITQDALVYGKHVLCEKPGAMTSDEIIRSLELSLIYGKTYMIGYNCRFHDGFMKARELYGKGKIGKPIFIRARFGFGGREGYNKEWRINKEIGGGGHLHDQGVHMIDMARFFLGGVTEVKGMRSDMFWKTGTEDNGFVLLKGKNGAIASIHSSLTQWKRMHSFEIYGDKGYIEVKGLGMRYGKPEHLIFGRRTTDPDVVKEKTIKCNAIADDSLKLELQEFLSAIEEKRQPVPSPQDAYETLRIVEEVYEEDKL